MTPHPRHDLDDLFQTPVRFSLMAALPPDVTLDFLALRDLLETSDSVMSKAISQLESAGYVTVKKGMFEHRPRTWVSSTRKGRVALERHLTALRAIAAGVLNDRKDSDVD